MRIIDPIPSAAPHRLISSVLLLSVLLGIPTVQATDPLSESLQQGLVAEEVHHNLEAAIAAYRSVIALHDEHRRLVATALFRLGESYRKQGKTTEAMAQYQRLLAEFSDQTELAQLSRTHLETLAPGVTIDAGPLPPAIQRQKELLKQELALVEQQIAAMQNRIKVGGGGSGDLIPLQREALTLQRQMAALEALRPDLLTVPMPDETSSRIDSVSEEELREIERLEAMIRHSPDLINATTMPAGGAPLHAAASQGHLAVARLLIENGADLEVRSNSRTPLHRAVDAGHKAMTELLLGSGAQVDAADLQGQTPLHAAAGHGFLEIAKVLLAAGADVNAAALSGTPLHAAVMQNRIAMIDLLFDSGADLEARTSDRFSPLPGITPLLHALSRESGPLVVERLLARGANVNATDAAGDAGLHTALEGEIPADTLRAILERKPDLEARGSQNLTPLQVACINRNYNAVRMLLEAGANPNVRFDRLGTRRALLKPQPEGRGRATGARDVGLPAARVVGRPGVRVVGPHARDEGIQLEPKGETPLHWAVWDWDRELTELLMEHGADVNAMDRHGHTPLLGAVEPRAGGGALSVDPVMVSRLLDAGADPNVSDQNGMSLFRHAIRVGSIELMAALLAKGVDPDLADSTGTTPMHAAALWSHANAVELLLEHEAELDRQDQLGNTPLHVAARAGRKDVVRFLLAQGALANARNQRGETPLDLAGGMHSRYAIEFGRGLVEAFDRQGRQIRTVAATPPPDIVELLLEHGAGATTTAPVGSTVVPSRETHSPRPTERLK